VPRATRATRGRPDAVADVLADDAGAQAGDLRPLREIHLRSPSGAAPTATQANSPSLAGSMIGYIRETNETPRMTDVCGVVNA